MPMEYGNDTTKEALLFKDSYYKDLQQVVSDARAICDRVYYVPGNVSPMVQNRRLVEFFCVKLSRVSFIF